MKNICINDNVILEMTVPVCYTKSNNHSRLTTLIHRQKYKHINYNKCAQTSEWVPLNLRQEKECFALILRFESLKLL